MVALGRAEIEGWLEQHGMVILAEVCDRNFAFSEHVIWVHHRDTRRGNWVSWNFVRHVACCAMWEEE